MMREKGGTRRSFAGWLHSIAYAVWLGGLIAIGAFVAPNAAHVIRSFPSFAADHDAQQAILIGIIGNSFRIFNYACYICGGVMIFCDLLQAASSEPTYGAFTWARALFTFVLIGSALYLGYYMFPHMDAARAHAEMTYFDKLHRRYVLISELQLIPLAIIPALTAKRDQAIDTRF
jgi:uncharacterized membrane protein